MQRQIKGVLPLLFLFLLSSIIYAPPPTDIFTQESSDGITIDYPKIEMIEQGQLFKIHAHIYNSTNYPLTKTGEPSTGCYIHIYNSQGSHIVEDEMVMDSNGMEYKYDFTLTQNIGEHSYIIWCNNTAEAGFLSANFQITPDGYDYDRYSVWFVYGGFVFILILFLFLAHYFKEDRGASVTYGFVGATLGFFMFVWSLANPVWDGILSYSIPSLILAVSVYSFLIGWAFYHDRG